MQRLLILSLLFLSLSLQSVEKEGEPDIDSSEVGARTQEEEEEGEREEKEKKEEAEQQEEVSSSSAPGEEEDAGPGEGVLPQLCSEDSGLGVSASPSEQRLLLLGAGPGGERQPARPVCDDVWRKGGSVDTMAQHLTDVLAFITTRSATTQPSGSSLCTY